MSLTTEIQTLLTSVSNVKIGQMPTTPDSVVCIFNTGGYPRSMTSSKWEEVTFQIRVRDLVYATGETTCNTVADLLHAQKGTAIKMIFQEGGINDMGRDENGRQEFTMNFRAYIDR